MDEIVYDAIVVGSGATGGWAAKILAEKGLKVLCLEAGRKMDPATEYTDHKWPYELPYRGFGDQADMQKTQPVQSLCYACNEYGRQFFVNDLDNPYTTPPDKPFMWIRCAAGRRSDHPVGPAVVSLLGLRLQGREPRRLRATIGPSPTRI